MKNPRNRILTAVLAGAFLALVIVALVSFVPVSAHMIGGTPKPVQNCHYLIGGASHQPCVHQPTLHPLSFTGLDCFNGTCRAYLSNSILIPAGNWTLSLECVYPAAGYPDQYDVSYIWKHNVQLPLEMHAALVCDGKYHSEPFHFKFSHPVQLMTSRPVYALVTF